MDEHGRRTAAGMKLSKLMRKVAQEQTETEGLDPETGETLYVSKAEALVRTIWKLALGYEEKYVEVDVKSGKPVERVKKHKPDRACIELIYDRMEGKVSTSEDSGKKRKPLSSKITDQAEKRVNAMARGVKEDDA